MRSGHWASGKRVVGGNCPQSGWVQEKQPERVGEGARERERERLQLAISISLSVTDWPNICPPHFALPARHPSTNLALFTYLPSRWHTAGWRGGCGVGGATSPPNHQPTTGRIRNCRVVKFLQGTVGQIWIYSNIFYCKNKRRKNFIW